MFIRRCGKYIYITRGIGEYVQEVKGMERILDVAQYIYDEYKRQSGESIDEMKLHKLLYFAQRESLAITNEPLFGENLEGWKYGPVSREVRAHYTDDGFFYKDKKELSAEGAYITKNVILQYGTLASWKLSQLSHNELSWKNSRKGLVKDENGAVLIMIDDIRKDAKKIRPYDAVYDMYYDEFEDAEVAQ